jgi:hypothetical protein
MKKRPRQDMDYGKKLNGISLSVKKIFKKLASKHDVQEQT